MTGTPYVQYGAFTNGPGPFLSSNAVMTAFFLRSDHDKLVALIDTVFNHPTGGQAMYAPLGEHIMLTFGEMKVTSTTPPFDRMGYVDELHAALWIPTVAVKPDGDDVVAQHLALFIPMIFVDNALSLVGGREVIGYAKNWGKVGLPTDGTALDTFTLDAFGGDFSPETSAHLFRCLTLTRVDDTPLRTIVLDGLEAAWDKVRETLFPDGIRAGGGAHVRMGLHVAESIFSDLVHRRMTQVFLRQFRSALDGTQASQQQVIETDTTMKNVHVSLVDHGYDVAVISKDSHPFATELGLTDQRVDFAMRISMDFEQENGRLIWDADTR